MHVDILAFITIACGLLSLLCLLILHIVSPEYQPSWRMISEYALGRHKWLITAFFLLWGLSSIFLSLFLWSVVTPLWAKLGVVLLLISGIGEIMGGLFDVKHKWHGLAFALGVPALPVAALLIGYNIIHLEKWENKNSLLLLASHAPWISLVIMAVAMAVMFAGFKKAGIPMDQNTHPPERIPEGVIALGGYANRLLVLCYVVWLLLVAKSSL